MYNKEIINLRRAHMEIRAKQLKEKQAKNSQITKDKTEKYKF